MSKKAMILSYVIFLAIISTNFFYFLSVETPIGSDNQNDNNINNLIAPKSSSYTITEKWNYTSTLDNIVISAEGNYIVLNHGGRFQNLTLFNKNSNDTLWNFRIVGLISYDISADGKYISAGTTSGYAYLYNNSEAIPSWSKEYMWRFNSSTTNNLINAISWDGKYIIVGNGSWIHLFNNEPQSGNKLPEWTYDCGNTVRAVDIGYNPKEGRYYIAIGDSAGNVTLFDETDPNVNGYIWRNDTTNSIDKLKISDDGSHILAKNLFPDNEIYLFDNTAQTPKLALWNYTTPNIVDIDISADGKKVLICNSTRIHYLNDTASNPKQPEWDAQPTSDSIYDGDISRNGQYVLVGGRVGGSTGFAKLYNSTKTQLKIAEWNVSRGNNMNRVAINKFGNYFAIIEDSSILYFYHYDVPLPRAIAAISGDGDDDDDEEEAVVPFGNYYLVFACAAIISLVVIMKRKVIFKTK